MIKKILKHTPLYMPLKRMKNGLFSPKVEATVFDSNAKNIEWENCDKIHYKSIAIVACFFKNPYISSHVIEYIKELKRYYDGIVLIADSPILQSEIEKIKKYVIFASFKHHGEYDFGSYKRGYNFLRQKGIDKQIEQLLLTNDSCFAPIYSLEPIFTRMNCKKVDFWGLIKNNEIQPHLQSWFLVFNKKLISSGHLGLFLDQVKKTKNVSQVILNYEVELTDFLVKKGFIYESYISELNPTFNPLTSANFVFYPADLLKQYKFPFVKIKAFTDYVRFVDERKQTMEIIKRDNPKFYDIICNYLSLNNIDASFFEKDCYYSNLNADELKKIIEEKDFQIKVLEKEKDDILNSKRWKIGSLCADLYHKLFFIRKIKLLTKKNAVEFCYRSIYQDNLDFTKYEAKVKALVFYLPQFHEFKENNEWWGKGFTKHFSPLLLFSNY